MSPVQILMMVCALLFAGDVALGGMWYSRGTTIDALNKSLTEQSAETAKQAAGLDTCNEVKDKQQVQIDVADQRARSVAQQQQDQAQTLSTLNTSLQADNDNLFQQLQEAINARPARVTVQQVYPEGWDPLVASVAQYVRGMQLAFAPGAPNGSNGGIQGALPAGGPGAPGAAPGAGLEAVANAGAAEARPSAQQQADFMSDYSRLWSWGAACYRDKAAITASQKAGPVAP